MSSIPLAALSVKPPPEPDFLGNYQKVMQLKNLAAQNQMIPGQQQIQQQQIQGNALGLQEKQKQIDDQAKIEKIITDSGNDIKSAIPKIMAVNPQLGIAYQKSILDSQTADLNQKKAVIGYHSAVSGRLAELAGGVKDEPSFHAAIGQALSEGLIDVATATKYLSQPFSPDEVAQIQQQALSAKEQADQADKAITQKETKRHDEALEGKVPDTEAGLAMKSAGGDAKAEKALTRLDQSKKASRPPNDSGEYHNQLRSDKSYQFNSAALDKLKTPVDALVSRLGRLNDTLAQNTPQADALVAPELMTVMAGGQGSGIRINEAEINRVVGGRSKWESLKAAINKWQLDPKAALSITPEQRKEIRDLTGVVNSKVTAKQQVLDDARQSLIGTDDPKEHRKIVASANSKMSAIDSGGAQGGGPAQSGAPSTVKMKAPNGQVSDVPSDQVEHYKSKGAVLVQ